MRTRVGYSGGTTIDPTYRELGDHTETLQVDFDPAVVSYADLLQVFWESHNPTLRRRNAQYKVAAFWHGAEQRRQAEESAARRARELGHDVTTEVLPATRFTRAEDYHQKYILRRHPGWSRALQEVYPDPVAFTDSTAAARLNGLLAGYGTEEIVREQVAPLSAQAPLST